MIHNVRKNFHGYHTFWTPDWYHRHPGAWGPTWIAPNRWWYRPSWHDTWGWFGAGFFTGVVVSNVTNSYPYYPFYYGDNVIYRGNMVYVNGVPYVSATEYYRQAWELANSPNIVVQTTPTVVVQQDVAQDNGPMLAPPTDEVAASNRQTVSKPATKPAAGQDETEEDWLPMGTFAFLDDSEDGDEKAETGVILQLATNKEGIIRGNIVNDETGEIRQVVGAVDSKTQRVALRFANANDDEKTIFECGLWNLTQDTVPLLIHRNEDETEQRTLIRLLEEDSDSTEQKQEGPFLFGSGESEDNLAP